MTPYPKTFIGLKAQLRSIKLRASAQREARIAFSDPNTPPILIYQMGKVGSQTVCDSLADAALPNPILHVHFLSRDLPEHRKTHELAGIYPPPYHIFLGEAVQRVLDKNRTSGIKVISLLRDPVALVISNLFQNPNFFKEFIINDERTIDPQKVIDYLDCELRNSSTFSYIYEWFDRELKSVFEIDVFANLFSKDVGYKVYSKNNVDALVIPLENLAEKGPKAISDFLNLSHPLVLKDRNMRSVSKDAEAYQKVLQNIYISPSLCEEIYASKFVKHFYNSTMIDRFISKWTKRGPGGAESS